MNKMSKYNSKIKLFGTAALLALCSSCGLLDMDPLNSITKDKMWQSKEDINKSLVATYDALQGCTEQFYTWSEVGGELLYVNLSSSDLDVAYHTMSESGGYANWNQVYVAIQRANLTEANVPQAQAIDATFSLQEMEYFTAECRAFRDLCYFYLARTFLEFPYIKAALLTDEDQYVYEPTNHVAVLDSIRRDLEQVIPMLRPNWNMQDFSDMNLKTGYTKGRIIRPVACAILADVYQTLGAFLTDGAVVADVDKEHVENVKKSGLTAEKCYEAVITYTDMIMNHPDPQYMFLSSIDNWFTIFYPGNSYETIFDIQYIRSATFVDIGWMYGAFRSSQKYKWQQNNTYHTFKQWEGEQRSNPYLDDKRGRGRSYISSGFGSIIDEGSTIWKFAAVRYDEQGENESLRMSETSDAINYPVYRMADIYLMRAEAYCRLDRMPEAADYLLKVRSRGIPTPDPALRGNAQTFLDASTYTSMSQKQFEDELLQERAAELGAEGKRWFDLVRFAQRRGDLNVIIDRLVEARSFESQRPQWNARLFRPEALYFPISRSELDNNRNLKQNVHYSTDFTAKD